MNNHPFHSVNHTPWPLTGSIGVLTIVSGIIKIFYMLLLYIGMLLILITII